MHLCRDNGNSFHAAGAASHDKYILFPRTAVSQIGRDERSWKGGIISASRNTHHVMC
jgi:hypothetical protein